MSLKVKPCNLQQFFKLHMEHQSYKYFGLPSIGMKIHSTLTIILTISRNSFFPRSIKVKYSFSQSDGRQANTMISTVTTGQFKKKWHFNAIKKIVWEPLA